MQCHAFSGRQRAKRRSHLLSFRISGSQFYGRHGGIFIDHLHCYELGMKTYLYHHSIPFQDTDMAGVVHYTRILGYAELAEHAFLLELGIPPISKSSGLPKVHTECDYLRPLRFADDITIELSLIKFSPKSIHWGFQITVNDEISSKGKLITAHVDVNGNPSEMSTQWQSLLGK